ncbi:MAG TPA: class I SAM-dependent methyltransferase [Verrucomicrobiae bacterium]
MAEPQNKESLVLFRASRDVELRGRPLQLTRFAVAFELYGAADELRLSESLRCFRIMVRGRTLYAGRAVVRSLVETGPALVCEAALDETAWRDLEFTAAMAWDGRLSEQFGFFLEEWQKAYLVRPEYKVIIADMQTFFADLRLWLQQVELGIRAEPEADRAQLELAAAEAVAARTVPCVNTLFEQFESFAGSLPSESLPAHRSYMRRQLHPLVLCSPFAHRTFYKPLGYAGDYEMVNMILRNGWEGDSIFAKVINTWFLRQPPAQAHRNRIAYLTDRLQDESLRVRRAGRLARIFNLACGPAHEVQRFINDSALSESAAFTLLDFNDETLRYVQTILDTIKTRTGRRTPVTYIHKSVNQLLKESVRPARQSTQETYDFVYCAGLFDYLSDQVCRRLMDLMYAWLEPGGLLVATNVEPANPLRNGMEHLLDWHLIYRTGPELAQLRPREAAPDQVRSFADATGANVFLEVRKLPHG